jgi:hypothetical protein
MEGEGFKRGLRVYSRRASFQPLTVELVSGGRTTVYRPEALVFRGGLAVYIAPDSTSIE